MKTESDRLQTDFAWSHHNLSFAFENKIEQEKWNEVPLGLVVWEI